MDQCKCHDESLGKTTASWKGGKKIIAKLQHHCQKLLSFMTKLHDGIRVIWVHMHGVESHMTYKNTNE